MRTTIKSLTQLPSTSSRTYDRTGRLATGSNALGSSCAYTYIHETRPSEWLQSWSIQTTNWSPKRKSLRDRTWDTRGIRDFDVPPARTTTWKSMSALAASLLRRTAAGFPLPHHRWGVKLGIWAPQRRLKSRTRMRKWVQPPCPTG